MVFLGVNYLEQVDKYLDIRILPPCLHAGGTGDVAVGMMQSLNGIATLPTPTDFCKSQRDYWSK